MIHIIYHETFHISCFIDHIAYAIRLVIYKIFGKFETISARHLRLVSFSFLLMPKFGGTILLIGIAIFDFHIFFKQFIPNYISEKCPTT